VTVSHVSTASFVAGGVGAAVGVLAWVLDEGDEPEGSENGGLVLRPILGPGGLGVSGRF